MERSTAKKEVQSVYGKNQPRGPGPLGQLIFLPVVNRPTFPIDIRHSTFDIRYRSEKSWGSEKFLFYYFLTGIGAGLCDVLVHPSATSVTIGASGAVYGLLLAFGMTYPDRPILIYFVIPIKAKYFVMIIGGIAFLSAVGSSGSGISHIAHLGGMIFGYLYLRRGTLFRSRLRYHEWREARRRKKFKVYMEKISREDPDRWVN